MQVTIYPSLIDGIIQAPASKSSMQRACAAALLSKGTTTIFNPGSSNDDLAALDVEIEPVEHAGIAAPPRRGNRQQVGGRSGR